VPLLIVSVRDRSQVNRFLRIKDEFGSMALLRTSVLLIGLCGMVVFDYFAFSSLRAGLITIVGLALGWLFRQKIPDGVEYYRRAIPAGLFVYSVTLLAGDLLGLSNSTKLAVITATTVIIFDLQFWSLSDSSVMNAERDKRRRSTSR
jgi:hypothetical protein